MRRRHRRLLGHDVVLRLGCMGVARFRGGGVLRDCLPPVAGGAVQAVSTLRLDANSNTPASPDPRCLFSNSYGGRHVEKPYMHPGRQTRCSIHWFHGYESFSVSSWKHTSTRFHRMLRTFATLFLRPS